MRRRLLVVFIVVALFVVPLFSVNSVFAAQQTTKLSKEFSIKQLGSKAYQEVIVELEDEPVIPFQVARERGPLLQSTISGENSVSYAEKLMLKQQYVLKEIKKISPDAKLLFSYQYTYNGFSLKIHGIDIKKLENVQGIKKVFPTKTYYATRDVAVPLIGAPNVWKMKDSKGNPVDGTGMLIGIIDTGIDYKHPDLGGGFGPGYKVVGGYDFGDDDADPMDQNGHGTHVAGIAAGDGVVKGVAPKAKLMAYKIVPGGQDSASDGAIIAAIEQAVKDKCNAVNLSFGTGKLGTSDPDDPENKAFDNAADAGVLAAVAAGNQGARSKSTPYPVGAPAGARKVITVGASDDAHHPSIYVTAPESYEKTVMGDYADVSPKFPMDKEFEIVACGYGTKSDFYGLDLTGKIALVSRGPVGTNAIYFRDKVLNAKAAGAAGVIIYNNIPGIVSPTLVVNPEDANKKFIPTIFITQVDGLYLKGLINKGLKIKFGETGSLGTMADFSSMGPTSDFYFKPEVAAPGVAINSTVPGGGYASWQGTSMATPFVTGSICLIKQMHSDWSSEQIKAALMNNATILKNLVSGKTITWTLQGAGRINIPAAIQTKAFIEPYDVLAKVDSFKPIEFTVQNASKSTESFTVSSKITSLDDGGLILPKDATVTIPAGESKTVDFALTFNKDKLSLGKHEGIVYFKSTDEILHVPFIIWNGDVSVPETLSNVSTSTDTITPGKTTMNFNFSLGTGSIIPPPEPKDRATNSNIIDEMQIRILGADDNVLGLIYDKALLLVGDYTFAWDGKDISGNYFLKDGTYKYAVAAVESNGNEENPQVDDAASVKGEFTVVSAPKTQVTVSVDKGSIIQGNTLSASVNVTAAEPVSEFKATITFDPVKLSIDPSSVKLGDFFTNAGAANPKFKVDNLTGELFVDVSMPDGGYVKPSSGAALTFTAKGKGTGKAKIGFRETNLVNDKNETILSLFIPTFVTVKEAPNPWDLNRDNKVDSADTRIFENSFGTQMGDADFNPQADFNKDGIVDGKDLIILAMHFGEVYP